MGQDSIFSGFRYDANMRQMSGFSTMNKFNLNIEICFQRPSSWYHLKGLPIYEAGITKYRTFSIINVTNLPWKSEVHNDVNFPPNNGNFHLYTGCPKNLNNIIRNGYRGCPKNIFWHWYYLSPPWRRGKYSFKLIIKYR